MLSSLQRRALLEALSADLFALSFDPDGGEAGLRLINVAAWQVRATYLAEGHAEPLACQWAERDVQALIASVTGQAVQALADAQQQSGEMAATRH